MSLLEQVKEVANFADDDSPQIQWSHVAFNKGELWAQGARGGALAKTPDIDISIAVPAKKLLKALQAVGDNPKLTVEDNLRLKLQGDGATARIEGMRIKDMPSFHRPPEQAEWRLIPGLGKIAAFDWCVSKDTTRRHLSGFHFNPDGCVEATDGHALICVDLQAKGQPDMLVAPAVLHGLDGDQWVAKADGRMFIAAEKGGAGGFRAGNLIDAMFPPAQQLIGGARDQGRMLVNRAAAVALLKKAKLSNFEVCLTVESGRLTAEVDGDRQGSLFGFASSVPFQNVKGEKEVPEGKIGFSLAFLLPLFASASSDEVTVFLSPAEGGGLDPLLLCDGPYTGVVMPYRLL